MTEATPPRRGRGGWNARPAVERFFEAIVVDANGCWRWQKAKTTMGYGQLNVDGRSRLVHRYAYELLVGPIPEGLTLDHLCRVRDCCFIGHLEAVSQRTNILRGTSPSARGAKVTHCPSGHPYDEANTYRHSRGRACRICAKDSSRRSEKKRGARLRDVPPSERQPLRTLTRTHCRQGHAFIGRNIYITARGDVICRECNLIATKAAQKKRRERERSAEAA